MNFVSVRGGRRQLAAGVALIVLACFASFAFAARAQAAETIYWDNYSAEPNSISFSAIDGSGGGPLNLTGATLEDPEGMAYDTVTNRIFVGSSHPESSDLGELFFVNLDGSGSGVLPTPGVVVEEPEGVAVDPATRMIYWVNTQGNGAADGSINWAKLDGSGGGTLNTVGASLESPYKIALDPVSGKVYWANTKPNPDTISWASVNGSGGGNLNLSGAPAPAQITGLSVDPAGGRIYWMDNQAEKIGYASLAGGGGGEVNLTGAVFGDNGQFDDPYGLAFDPSIGRLYWGNYGQTATAVNGIGFANIAGGVGGITPTGPLKGPQDPVIIKSPSGTGAPTVTRNSKDRAKLSCSEGSWGADYPGGFVYQAPRSFAFQWTLNGKAIQGATANTITASKPGNYACVVTATNQSGSASQSSAALKVTASKVKLTTKKKASGKPGQVVKFKVKAANQGDVKSKNAKVCVKLPKSAKGALKAPKCKSIGKLKGRAKKSAVLKIKVLPSAGGTYKVTFQVKGSAGKAAKAKIVVG